MDSTYHYLPVKLVFSVLVFSATNQLWDFTNNLKDKPQPLTEILHSSEEAKNKTNEVKSIEETKSKLTDLPTSPPENRPNITFISQPPPEYALSIEVTETEEDDFEEAKGRKDTKRRDRIIPIMSQLKINTTKNMQEDDVEYLLNQHRLYLDHQITNRENLLAEEIKQLYCKINDLDKRNIFLLAQANGLLAARALKQKTCDRIQSNGMTLVLQTCAEQKIVVSARETPCGYQPLYVDHNNKSFTIGKDGWSLIPFKDCFSIGPFVNLNGETFSFTDGNWKKQQPNIHLQRLKLVDMFKENPIIDLDLTLAHHKSYDTNTMEQVNVMADLISTMQENHGNSISDIVLDVQAKSNVYTFSNWFSYIRNGLFTIAIFILALLGLKIIFTFRKAILGCCLTVPKRVSRKKNVPLPKSETPLLNLQHDHTDIIYIPNKGLFWKDMCPVK